MKLHTAPNDQAVFGNVQEFGEFRIRNSAKAFSILSSGLYANKIRAIVRELSCNALDSHRAANKGDVPFELHLPTTLEPWFSIRDYGQGLDHDQVTNVYTTYFESTKTNSNAFIGALGLGCKSPYSYTNNFTVTAIKDGIKGIYSAFINDHGIPSIARMSSNETDEDNGLEVKFSVHNQSDNYKFEAEAIHVFKFFKNRPHLTGKIFKFEDVKYEQKDIVPGVHQRETSRNSIAVMGNIPYPIEIPNAEAVLGELAELLDCNLQLDFNIGELDFQASREGLSYIPETIAAIKNKLQILKDNLDVIFFKEADEIENLWERTNFIKNKSNSRLWKHSAQKYVTDRQFPLIKNNSLTLLPFSVNDLAEKFNIEISAYYISYNKFQKLHPEVKDYINNISQWKIKPSLSTYFVVDNIPRGIRTRIQHNFKNNNYNSYYIISAADKTKSVKIDEFFDELYNPPRTQIIYANALEAPQREKRNKIEKNVTVLTITQQRYGLKESKVWVDAGNIEKFDTNEVHYYVPLNGFTMISDNFSSAKELHDKVAALPTELQVSSRFYGVRKADIETVKNYPNWVNYEDYLRDKISKVDEKILLGLALSEVDTGDLIKYIKCLDDKINNKQSLFIQVLKSLKDVPRIYNVYRGSYTEIIEVYNSDVISKLTQIKKTLEDNVQKVNNRYPLLDYISLYSLDTTQQSAIADYINLIDEKIGE